MRIGLLSGTLDLPHGLSAYCTGLVESLERAGIDVVALSPKDSKPDCARACLPECAPLSRYAELEQLFSAIPVALKLRNCDLIHALVSTYAPLAAVVKGARPLVVTAHGSYVTTPKTGPWLRALAYSRAMRYVDRLICVSSNTRVEADKHLPHTEKSVVNPGVRIPETLPPVNPSPKPVVLCVGAIKRRKAQLELIKAVQQVRALIPDVECRIVGTDNYAPEYGRVLKNYIQENHLGHYVFLLGEVSSAELDKHFREASVFVLPAVRDDWRFEGFGIVYLEAALYGLPCIGTLKSGATDAIENGITGILIDPDRMDEELSASIRKLLLDPSLRRSLGQAGRDRARRQSWDAVAHDVISIYETLLASQSLLS